MLNINQKFARNSSLNILCSGDWGSDEPRMVRTLERAGQPLIDTIGAIISPAVWGACKQKGGMRLLQAVSFAVTGDVKDCDPVTARMIACVMLTTDRTVNFEALRYASGQNGMLNPSTIQGVTRNTLNAKLTRFVGLGGTAGTISSKVSRTFGRGGFMTALGVSVRADLHTIELTPEARNNLLVLGYANQLQAMTQGSFELLTEV